MNISIDFVNAIYNDGMYPLILSILFIMMKILPLISLLFILMKIFL